MMDEIIKYVLKKIGKNKLASIIYNVIWMSTFVLRSILWDVVGEDESDYPNGMNENWFCNEYFDKMWDLYKELIVKSEEEIMNEDEKEFLFNSPDNETRKKTWEKFRGVPTLDDIIKFAKKERRTVEEIYRELGFRIKKESLYT